MMFEGVVTSRCVCLCQTLFESVVTACENGGRRLPVTTQLGYTREQADAIQRLKNAKDNHEQVDIIAHASK